METTSAMSDTEFRNHPLTIAMNYVVLTLTANYWYEALPRYGGQSNLDIKFTDARARWYDRAAVAELSKLNDEQKEIARGLYHDAYKRGARPSDYSDLPVLWEACR